MGLSGGVDSSVAAALLKEAGYEVTAVFLKTFENKDTLLQACPWQEDLQYATDVSHQLQIPLEVWNYEREYHEEVIRYFTEELAAGRTPNPDILCNSQIKFGACLKRTIEKKFDYFATGHYARTICTKDRHVQLLRGVDRTKDQSYFLASLNEQKLSSVLFPVGQMTKQQVRSFARSQKLATAERKDSQGICFIGDINYRSFVQSLIPDNPGNILDVRGNVLGTHPGIHHFTIGQRYGLGIGGLAQPMYVCKKKILTNELIVCQQNDPHLYAEACECTNMRWISGEIPLPITCNAQIRYRQPASQVTVQNKHGATYIQFHESVRAVSPGQLLALYKGDQCLASATIVRSCPIAEIR